MTITGFVTGNSRLHELTVFGSFVPDRCSLNETAGSTRGAPSFNSDDVDLLETLKHIEADVITEMDGPLDELRTEGRRSGCW